MAFENIKAMTKVEANGSLVLHEELEDESLDFFIVTSSVASVTGNRKAILASPVNSGVGPEVITGIRNLEPDALQQCAWAKDRMFAHLTTQRSATNIEPDSKYSYRRQLSKRLTAPSTSSDEIRALVTDALVRGLGVLLQMEKIDETKTLLDLGIGTLLIAEIAIWARKELAYLRRSQYE
ncbi:uncharacterized protein M421DRAFT_6584 [Didymella exigua CBS 183.55]|uniref:Ketoreductase (KR) domain-containing protein n=1 Tax=Didymella exigua CBS 183.55 TaxID=1150837 RepID=A0A6A5RKX8_9PLEO|nr:uncharacterized protein M421DRAFT_6584 [Didymella exigua CBS 183.55]KAF1927026.1 hypothetical protein M421DRAFT_6584 [Didymella exigua CBS 183.55]